MWDASYKAPSSSCRSIQGWRGGYFLIHGKVPDEFADKVDSFKIIVEADVFVGRVGMGMGIAAARADCRNAKALTELVHRSAARRCRIDHRFASIGGAGGLFRRFYDVRIERRTGNGFTDFDLFDFDVTKTARVEMLAEKLCNELR